MALLRCPPRSPLGLSLACHARQAGTSSFGMHLACRSSLAWSPHAMAACRGESS